MHQYLSIPINTYMYIHTTYICTWFILNTPTHADTWHLSGELATQDGALHRTQELLRSPITRQREVGDRCPLLQHVQHVLQSQRVHEFTQRTECNGKRAFEKVYLRPEFVAAWYRRIH
jgi:hypothetical protein